MRVIFWGSPQFAVGPLEAIYHAGYQVVSVVCQPDRPSGRGRKLTPPPVKQSSLELDLPVLQPDRPRGDEFLSTLRNLHPDISVVVAYGHILRPEVLSVPPQGSINLHASLLPAWRGAAPIQRAVAAGDTESGLTVIQMDEGMDSGDILAVERMPVGPLESAGELAARMSEAGGPLLVDTLRKIELAQIIPQPQDHSQATFAPKIDREEARVDWSKPARQVADSIRAFDPVPGAWTTRDGDTLKLFRPVVEYKSGRQGEAFTGSDGSLVICCGEGSVALGEIQAQGKKRMAAADYLRGHPITDGESLK
jgi:methionyl-tRNA formyltransferase